jgi:hypothetical protein
LQVRSGLVLGFFLRPFGCLEQVESRVVLRDARGVARRMDELLDGVSASGPATLLF